MTAKPQCASGVRVLGAFNLPPRHQIKDIAEVSENCISIAGTLAGLPFILQAGQVGLECGS